MIFDVIFESKFHKQCHDIYNDLHCMVKIINVCEGKDVQQNKHGSNNVLRSKNMPTSFVLRHIILPKH